ncbi:MAG: M23 family metallopeptidase [Hyphomicrobiales bacterium]|nr:M23 family metallopeptidase [Hyphomicrobiales bacterium]
MTLSHGHRAKTLAFRPWQLHGALALVPLLAAWGVASGLYLGFHDQIMSGIIAQRTRMQLSYEDKLAKLRSQIETVTSHQLVDQSQFEARLQNLSQRQILLEKRASVIGALAHLVETPDTTGSITGTGRHMGASSGSFLSSNPSPSQPAPAFPDAAKAKPRPEAMLGFGHYDSADFADNSRPVSDQLKSLSAHEAQVEFQQLKTLALLEAPARQKASHLRHIIQLAGLSGEKLEPMWQQSGMGGPFIPLETTISGGAFAHETQRIQGDIVEVARLHALMPFLPLGRPLRNQPTITSGFGPRVDPFLGRISVHPGIDFRERLGTPIHATGAGKVVVAEYNGGYGNMVEIDHGNGLHTRYGHMSQIEVQVGQRVKKGSELGLSGSTGRSTGPHLHYEVRQNGIAVNPERFLDAGSQLASNS